MKPYAWLALLLTCCAANAQERRNWFDDPFVQVTAALPGCPQAAPPAMTKEEMQAQAHVRSQHGFSCHRSGRCRLPNSYLYDKEIIPRVALYLQRDGRFDDTTVWIQGERRLVFLMGCVRTRQQSEAMEKAVLLVDDVVGVINLLSVGVGAEPRYPVVGRGK